MCQPKGTGLWPVGGGSCARAGGVEWARGRSVRRGECSRRVRGAMVGPAGEAGRVTPLPSRTQPRAGRCLLRSLEGLSLKRDPECWPLPASSPPPPARGPHADLALPHLAPKPHSAWRVTAFS